jgi:cytochrome b
MTKQQAPATGTQAVRVWDLPTRIFHWLLAACVTAQLITGKIGGGAMQWHFRVGYCILALLGFRLVWGLIGGHWSRFANFIYSPATVLRYLRGDHRPGDNFDVGHNPLGSGSVFALLVLLLAQACTGLVADDEIGNTGPLNKFVANATAATATAWHKGPGQGILIALVLLHVGAILFYLLRRGNNLVRPMLTGDKHLSPGVPAAEDTRHSRALALAVLALVAGIVTWLVKLGA